mmetsp:Transcript_10873/g.21755  ORF Transcript_10873/g.21755 Transcript_10873/m.21755 type:complete len:104 (-) Transcript_10873:113-424(-)
MDRSDHVLLIRPGTDQFSLNQGLQQVENDTFSRRNGGRSLKNEMTVRIIAPRSDPGPFLWNGWCSGEGWERKLGWSDINRRSYGQTFWTNRRFGYHRDWNVCR